MSDFDRLVEKSRRELDSGSQQLFGEFGTDTGSCESSNDFALGRDAAFLEYKNILQGDDLAFHARHFGDIDASPRTIA